MKDMTPPGRLSKKEIAAMAIGIYMNSKGANNKQTVEEVVDYAASHDRSNAMSQTLLAKKRDGDPLIWRCLGFEFTEETDGVLVRSTLPDGWWIKPTDHPIHNHIVGPSGELRGSYMYKAGLYDRDATASLLARYCIDNKSSTTHVPLEERAVIRVVTDRATGKTIEESEPLLYDKDVHPRPINENESMEHYGAYMFDWALENDVDIHQIIQDVYSDLIRSGKITHQEIHDMHSSSTRARIIGIFKDMMKPATPKELQRLGHVANYKIQDKFELNWSFDWCKKNAPAYIDEHVYARHACEWLTSHGATTDEADEMINKAARAFTAEVRQRGQKARIPNEFVSFLYW